MNLADKLTEERRGRLAAERMLELKQAELHAANRKLGLHARELTEKIVKTRAVVETIRDENQRFRSDLTAANQKIALTERRLWHTIETIKDGFAFFNIDNEMIMANQAYLAVFDGLEEIRPGVNYVTILQVLTEEGIVNTGALCPEKWREQMTERLYLPEPPPTVIQLWNGTHIKLINQRGPEGDMVSLGLDITATVTHERSLKEARTIAESANRAKSAFLANISHEIRTPMNGVVGMAEVLSETPLTDEQQLYVETIKNSGEALLLIINDVLDYSKVEAGKLDLHVTTFDLEQVVLEVLMLLQPSAGGKNLHLLMAFDMRLPTAVSGDPGRLRQILTNLIGNAIKFTATGHVAIRISADETDTARIHFAIEDTGIGIPPDKLKSIFDEFNQVENERNRQFDGTGLGLAISQRLVGMMGGEISVESTDGLGSTFAFALSLPQAPTAKALPSVHPDLLHVLVLDTLEISGDILQRQLELLGLKVTRCSSADTALEHLDETIAVVIADHAPPVLDGVALARHIADGPYPVPVLLVSPTPYHDQGAAPGVQAFLTKPTARKDLLTHLATLAPPTFQRREDTPEPALRKMRILAAEDNRTNQLVFGKMIKSLNIELIFAANGEEAVALYTSFQPDLVFMDISMPRMDGKEATRAIRALETEGDRTVPIIALTAHAMESDVTAILDAGLDHCLTKPLRKKDIVDQIAAAHQETKMAPLFPQEDETVQLAG